MAGVICSEIASVFPLLPVTTAFTQAMSTPWQYSALAGMALSALLFPLSDNKGKNTLVKMV